MEALSNFILYKRTQEVVDFSRQIISTTSEEEVVKLLAQGLRKLLSFDSLAIFFAHRPSSMLYPMVVDTPLAEKVYLNEWAIPLESGIVGRCIKAGKSEFVTDVQADLDVVEKFFTGQLIVIPLKFAESCWGALALNRQSDVLFINHEFEVAECLVSYASLALGNITFIKQLKEKEKAKKAILQAIPDTILRIKVVSEHIKFFSFEGDEVENPFFFLEHQHHELKQSLLESIGTGKGTACEHYIESTEGIYFFETRLIPISSAECLSITRDITELKRTQQDLLLAKQQAEESTKAKQEFLAKMSHELRTPLNGVIGLTNLMITKPQTGENREYLRSIKSSGEHLLAIINDILDLSKIEAGKLQIEEQVFSPKELLQSVNSNLCSLAEQKGIQLKISDESLPEYLYGDPVRVNQILLNLVSNAVKFTDKGYVQVKCFTEGVHGNKINVRFEIKDTGIGIQSDKLSKIFESFTQADAEITARYGGTGLGLAIVKQLIEMQHGSISVSSVYGSGSTFTVRLPFGVVKEKPSHEIDNENLWRTLEPFENVRVLLAEDNPINQVVGVKTLESWNLNVTLVTNGVQVLTKLEEEEFDIILMDIQMPEMNGIDATRAIRSSNSKKKKNIPVLAMTASVHVDSLDVVYKAGINDHISKPFRPHELHAKINALLKDVPKTEKVTWQKDHEQTKKSGYFDRSFIEAVCYNDKEAEEALVDTIISTIPELMEEITMGMNNGDEKMCRKALHKVKGSLGMLGIDGLYKDADHLEKSQEKLSDQNYRNQIVKLMGTMELLLEQIKQTYGMPTSQEKLKIQNS